jgi:hypothetical protein
VLKATADPRAAAASTKANIHAFSGGRDSETGAVRGTHVAPVGTLAFRGGTESSNLLCSSGQSVSRGTSPPRSKSRAFPAGVRAGATGAGGRDGHGAVIWRRLAGNISVGPNSSTAASMRRWLNESGSGSAKAEQGALLVPGQRQTRVREQFVSAYPISRRR